VTYDHTKAMRRPGWIPGLFVLEGLWFDGLYSAPLAPYALGPYDAAATDWELMPA
jgi:hypothetical protein